MVNPWITDFAAYDLWAKPLGLLFLASLLREGGCEIAFVDCVNRADSATDRQRGPEHGAHGRYGTGKYHRMPIPKPDACNELPRYYYRYGMHPDELRSQLDSLPRPDLIWVTSIMTYWYPGVQQTISILREVFADTPIWLGGVYAQLCADHARRHSGADEIVTISPAALPVKFESATGFKLKNKDAWGHFSRWPSPALDLITQPAYAPLLTSVGCPFRCPYCASSILQPRRVWRKAESIHAEVLQYYKSYGIRDYAFYDDALLLGADNALQAAMEMLARDSVFVRFHTPNAIHIRAITREMAEHLQRWGFETIRLGLETTKPDNQRKWGGKVDNSMFFSAVSNLLSSGFQPPQIGVYLLCGLPGQTPKEVGQAIKTVQDAGVMPHIAEYSPVPGTAMWKEAQTISRYDLEGEPLYHNNTFFACRRPEFSYEDLCSLKELAREARRSIKEAARHHFTSNSQRNATSPDKAALHESPDGLGNPSSPSRSNS